ncbi:PREDICTED: uncharacterized protein LOC109583144 [Amphimedon queenslandica]|uniref:Uncharacterized protein n=1 Tax=Amphimedon queenslandica TaxID=400682 RepID=A0A1X7UJB9_AMPQE|nr:PREDICTED: uncharacterized protein LOC109583144 [Amphimedon queenslandica]|eukprot:XP_019853914.1 PREDICTED: uncharacterized protein LOC109583144 [Amphimedon queenslandica]
MGNCCGSRSNTVDNEGDPDPTPKPIPLGTTNAVVVDIVYYEDPTPAAVSSYSYALTDSPVATLDCVKATKQIQGCLGLIVQVSITKEIGFKARYEQDFTDPKPIINVTVTPEADCQWPPDSKVSVALQGQLKEIIENEWKLQLHKDYFALITMKDQ